MTRQNHKILSILSILSVLLSAYYPIVIGRLHVWLWSASPSAIKMLVSQINWTVVAFYGTWSLEPWKFSECGPHSLGLFSLVRYVCDKISGLYPEPCFKQISFKSIDGDYGSFHRPPYPPNQLTNACARVLRTFPLPTPYCPLLLADLGASGTPGYFT